MDNTILNVTFEGGMTVTAAIRQFAIATDQSAQHGGADSAPTPFELLFASLATCAGVFAKRFCDKKGIATEGVHLRVECEPDPDPKKYRMQRVHTVVVVPESFPKEYETALIRTVEGCPVKKQILEPPQFSTSVERA